ncbi:SusC/RagA family TonB-linked outer membrane protein [Prolixibacteraceae bacterium JC049]|nr:SusC/RagA family TonB-linked outer membrane protein [Prolixibacteraceae bacterium JC049]
MKKLKTFHDFSRSWKQTLLTMKLIIALLLGSLLSVHASSYSQNAKLTLKMRNATLKSVLKEIEAKSDFYFFFNEKELNTNQKVSINLKQASVQSVLDKVLADTGMNYEVVDRYVVIRKGTKPAKQKGEIKIKGKVEDKNGEPIPGVSVIVKGTTIGITTDFDGNYLLNVPASGKVLSFSFVGMKSVDIPMNGQTEINVVLEEDAIGLEEVVAVGYGVQKKVSLTGAVSSVSPEKIASRPVSSMGKALQGVAPGLVIIDRGGLAGSEDINMQIRGNTSLSGSSSPLVYVDGIEQNLSDLDPNNIESISILKDAASTAIYGSRGANGVILITTKRSKSTGLRLAYNGYLALQEVTKLPEKVGIRDYMTLYNEAFANDGQPKPFTDQDIENTVNGVDPIRWPNTDWHDVIFQTAPQHNHSLSAMGGTEKLKFNMALNYLEKNNLERYGVRFNTDYQISKKLKARVDVHMRKKDWSEPRNKGTVFWRLFHDMPPWGLPKLPDGRYGTSLPGNNQLARLESGKKTLAETYNLFNARVDYEVLPGLTLIGEYMNKSTALTEREHQKAVKLYNWNGTYAKDLVSENSSSYRYKQWKSIQLRGLIQYQKTFGDHSVKGLLGAERISDNYQWVYAKRSKAYNDILDVINAGDSETDSNGGNETNLRIGSYLGRVNYDYKGKYLFEANFRYDGSSRFAPGSETRWGFFPSFSAGWRLSEENFMKSLGWLNNLKIRGSYGATGKQDNIKYWQYISDIAISNVYAFGQSDKAVQGAWQSRLSNSTISWETTKILDIGFDAELWDGKLGVTFDYYKKNTEDVLNDRVPIPRTIGFPNPAVNAGEIENKGWELSLSHRNRISDDFSYDISFNISDNKSKVINLVGTGPYVSGWTVAKVGLPLWALWGYETNGFYKDEADVKSSPLFDTNTIPGDVKYVDRNGDKKINGDDKMYLGDASPHFPIAMNINLKYKQFDLGLYWQGVLKQLAYMEGALTEGPNYGNFTHKAMLNRWTPATANTATWPVLRKNSWKSQLPSDFWTRKAAYLRLKNIQLGYTFSKQLVEKLGVQRVRVYVSADNLFTISQEKLIDPEFKPGRVNYHPQTKLYLIGLNVNF